MITGFFHADVLAFLSFFQSSLPLKKDPNISKYTVNVPMISKTTKLRVFIKASAEVPTVMTRSVTTVYPEAQFQFLLIISSHLLANLGHIYQVCSSSILSTLVSALLPFYPFSSSPPPVSFQPFSLFSQPKRGDTAINLRVANELHLTIKCTGNGTFHLQEDQWQ